jgi:hypothetical protein
MTQSARWFRDVAEAIFAGISAQTDDTLNGYVGGIEGLEERDVFLVQVATGIAPEPLTAEQFVERSPYRNPEAVEEDLTACAGRGWLGAQEAGGYTPTVKGRETAEGIFAFAIKLFGGLDRLPDSELKRLAELLRKVVDEAKALPEPAAKLNLAWRDKFDWGPDAPLMVQVRSRLLDLLGYRDDVHIAAWQPYESDGRIWEAFTYVWRDQADTAAELAEQLPYRNYDEAAYAAALQDLAARGWIAEEEGKYVATARGQKLRQEAEDTTDRYYDAAWVALSGSEMEEVQELLNRLAEAVKPPEEEPA